MSEEPTDAELLDDVMGELRYLFEHDNGNGGRIVEGLNAMMELKFAMMLNEISDKVEEAISERN